MNSITLPDYAGFDRFEIPICNMCGKSYLYKSELLETSKTYEDSYKLETTIWHKCTKQVSYPNNLIKEVSNKSQAV